MASTRSMHLAKLLTLTSGQLSLLYGNSSAGAIPRGDSHGKAIFMPGTKLGGALSAVADLLWKGKVFNADGKGLINKILGLKLVRAVVYRGVSWSDGKESIVLDYLKTSLLAFFIRDEIRLVAPSVYLGRVYIRLPFNKKFFALWFALEFSSQSG